MKSARPSIALTGCALKNASLRPAFDTSSLKLLIFTILVFRQMVQNTPTKNDSGSTPGNTTLRWVYFWLPALFLILSIVLAIVSLALLPETVTWGFHTDTPERTLGRTAFAIWTVAPQLLCFLLALVVVRIVLFGAGYWSDEAFIMKRLVTVMGNLLAIPQLILLFAMLEIFIYNSYQVHLIPVWLFAVIVLAGSGIYLILFFTKSIYQVRRLRKKPSEVDINVE